MEEAENKFLCPYCRTIYTDFTELKNHVLAEHKGQEPPAPEGMLRLNINGDDFLVRAEPEWTLYYLLHDVIGITSPKMFCDRGACGSCTVIMNGRPILSCMSLAVECDGAVIETAEGVAAEGHPLVESYVKHHAMQCGYCTPGFITTAKVLLERDPSPSREKIVDALGGNLCRCGTYPAHISAIQEAAEIMGEGEDG